MGRNLVKPRSFKSSDHAQIRNSNYKKLSFQNIFPKFRKFFQKILLGMLVKSTIFVKHFTVPEHFSKHKDSKTKMFGNIDNLTSISSEKNLPLTFPEDMKNTQGGERRK